MLRVALKVLAVGIALAGASHVLMGPTADLMLGVKLPASTVIEPSLDSQNRFYGAIFTLYAALLWLAANDLPRYRIVLRLVLAWFFIGGLMRLVSLALRGWPSEMILLLTLLELVVPPLLWWAALRGERSMQEQWRA
jgi:hypothetical protein